MHALSDNVAQQDLEGELAAMFAEVLELELVAADEDFFDAGGDSLRATRVISRIYRNYGAELTFDDLFDAPTPVTLARLVRRRAEAGEGSSGV
jgi:aryl carrier-like protein